MKKLAADSDSPNWWYVTVDLHGQFIDGFVHSAYLKSGRVRPVPVRRDFETPTVDMKANGHRRRDDFGRAFPLDESDMPARQGASAPERVRAIISIIDYLDPADPAHSRYIAGGGKTYCNIYAYDFCQRASAYMPRIWWTRTALDEIREGTVPPILYGNTVGELNANALHDWFIEFGNGFGRSREFDADRVQSAVQEGAIGVIVAKRKNVARSGHIAVIVPEHGGVTAGREGGRVVRPVLSQAGATNFKVRTPSTPWWSAPRFQSFGFWIHK